MTITLNKPVVRIFAVKIQQETIQRQSLRNHLVNCFEMFVFLRVLQMLVTRQMLPRDIEGEIIAFTFDFKSFKSFTEKFTYENPW